MKKLIALIKSAGKSRKQLVDEVKQALKRKGIPSERQVIFFKNNPKYLSRNTKKDNHHEQ